MLSILAYPTQTMYCLGKSTTFCLTLSLTFGIWIPIWKILCILYFNSELNLTDSDSVVVKMQWQFKLLVFSYSNTASESDLGSDSESSYDLT